MHVSSVGYLNQKGLRTVEDYNVQSRYDKASLFGQIEHNPVDIESVKQDRDLFNIFKDFCTGKKEVTRQQALDMIA